MQIIELVLDDNDENGGINAISLVDEPAIDSDWIMLEKEYNVNLKVVDDARKILMGVILIPNKPILRRDKNGDPFYVFFSKKTSRNAMQKYMKNQLQGQVTLEHKESANNKAYITEIWEKEHEVHDKSVMYGLNAPVGSIIGTMKVEDDRLLQMCKDGKINGFSIEGIFPEANKIKMSSEKILEKIKKTIQDGEKENK
jgi:uncharacterized protein YuzE